VVAQKVLSDLNNGADFAAVCKEYSLDLPTKDKGGDTGYFIKGSLLPEFEEACDKLEVGQMSGIVKTGLGYHIIKVTERKEAKKVEYADVKEQVKENYIEEETGKLVQKLKQDAKIEITEQ